MAVMPEGDTVWLAAKRLDERLSGRVLSAADLRVPALATVELTGRTVTAVIAHGKHLFTRFDDDTSLHSHFRMDGSWHLYRTGQRWHGGPTYDIRALLRTAEWDVVGYRLHDLGLVRTANESTYDGHLGPDVLRPDWDPATAIARILREPDRTIGEAILDQRNLAGVGNMYACEALFICRVRPWQRVDAVDVPAVVATSAELLQRNKGQPEQVTTGMQGRDRAHWVHGRHRRPCRRCGTPIQIGYLGEDHQSRVNYYCPTCQIGPGPTRRPPVTKPPGRGYRPRS